MRLLFWGAERGGGLLVAIVGGGSVGEEKIRTNR